MYGFGGVGLSEVQISISELSVVGGGWVVGGGGWTGQTHFMVGPGRGPTNISTFKLLKKVSKSKCLNINLGKKGCVFWEVFPYKIK